MQLTSILSDLNSLRACDHASALALVSARPSTSTSPSSLQTSTTLDLQSQGASDPDLRRPHELQTLHDNIKLAYGSNPLSGPTPAIRELQEARSSVRIALERLGLGVERGGIIPVASSQQYDAQQHQPSQRSQQVQQTSRMSMEMDEDNRQDAEYDDDEMAAWS